MGNGGPAPAGLQSDNPYAELLLGHRLHLPSSDRSAREIDDVAEHPITPLGLLHRSPNVRCRYGRARVLKEPLTLFALRHGVCLGGDLSHIGHHIDRRSWRAAPTIGETAKIDRVIADRLDVGCNRRFRS